MSNANDNTTLSAGTGGDIIRTEQVDYDSNGNPIKVQLFKLLTGRGRVSLPGSESTPGVDEGAVSDTNPFPVLDNSCKHLLEEILLIDMELLEVLKEIRDSMQIRQSSGRKPVIGRP